MRILILGGNGMIGHKMYQVLSERYTDTWILIKRSLNDISFSNLYDKSRVIDQTNLTNLSLLTTILENIQPDIIINAVGITIRRGIDHVISDSIIINAALPHFLSEWVGKYSGKRFIHFSTDCVFSGKKGAYEESDITDAYDTYGRTKALGEVARSAQTLTLRGSMIGRELENKTELLEWFLKQSNKSIKGFSGAIYSGITTNQMAKYVLKIINDYPDLSGVYNVSSEPISKLELLNLFNKAFNVGAVISDDTTYHSKKDLISDRFYKTIGEKKLTWDELIEDLRIDSEKYFDIYK
ncbi:MAG: sugar nucleotide-binding protein [Chitinophagaceae bacterium]|nr:sugar nucleotide-binding protein [Chitinophagaceae bacterium]MCA6459655.1 sugar nucleotide-binding protein [Chitinophagaceae bacterium]MCA6464522.1 sugar nucleotide-binding protein [Chitinophagaceae bacterium]